MHRGLREIKMEKELQEKTYCNNYPLSGCEKMTSSILSEDGTHYNCKECGAIK